MGSVGVNIYFRESINMKKRRNLTIGVILLTILSFFLVFEWLNVESWYEDLSFVGNDDAHGMNRDLLIVKALLTSTVVGLFICLYKLNKIKPVSGKTNDLQ